MSVPDRERMTVLTLPNCLSLSRIALIPAIASATLHDAGAAALGLFCLAVLTDVLDGFVARRRHQVSRLGTLVDHASDAVFVTSLCALWAWFGLLPPLLPALIAFAFIQYTLDSRVLDGASLRRSPIGRCNGIAYFIVAGLGTVVHHYAEDAVCVAALGVLGWVLVATTLISMAERAIHQLRALRRP